MSLRVRLIVAFFVLSVVPLGAVTFYTYTSNVKALREAAAHEADLLAAELSQRMQLVTTQLSKSVGQLMDMADESEPQPTTKAVARNTAPKPTQPSVAEAEMEASNLSDQVANALGEAAILLNNVELPRRGGGGGGRGRGGGGPRPGPPPGSFGSGGRPGPPGSSGSGASSGSSSSSGSAVGSATTGQTPPPGSVASGAPAATQSAGESGPRFGGDRPPGPRFRPGDQPGGLSRTGGGGSSSATMGSQAGANTSVTPATPATPGGPSQPARPPAAGATIVPPTVPGQTQGAPFRPPPPNFPGGPPPPADPTRIQIDTSAIWQELMKQIVPEGQQGELTQEQRQRLMREVNQRLLGIQEGIRQGAVVLQKKAEEARQKAEADTKAAIAAAAKAAGKATAPTATTTTAAATSRPAGPLTRKAALSGTKIAVTMEQNGEIVSKVNAEINLPNLLMTVFSTIGREQGEVPFAVAKDGHVYTPSDSDLKKVMQLGSVTQPDAQLGRTVLPEWVVVTTADPSGSGLRFGIARPVGDSLNSLRRNASVNAGIGLLFIGVAIAGIIPLSGRLTRNLTTLIEGVGRIAQGDFRARVPVRSHDEMGKLAVAFNKMAEDVERHEAAVVGQERLKRELELGRQIQHDMLPHEPMRFGLTEIQGVSVPAREVGGDFFNYFALPTGHVALLVGDVSGKGVGAALLMANIQASLRTRFSLGQDLSAIANEIDKDIDENSPGSMYATLFVGILDPATRVLRYVNAGHHPQFILRQQGGLERMSSTGLPVGLLSGRGYRELSVQLAPGDLVFFYTDGCVETEDEAGDMFGTERLEELLLAAHSSGADDVMHRVERAMEQFRGARELYDDATMMAVRIG